MHVNQLAYLFPLYEMAPTRHEQHKVRLNTWIAEDLMRHEQDLDNEAGVPITVIAEEALTMYVTAKDLPEKRRGRK